MTREKTFSTNLREWGEGGEGRRVYLASLRGVEVSGVRGREKWSSNSATFFPSLSLLRTIHTERERERERENPLMV